MAHQYQGGKVRALCAVLIFTSLISGCTSISSYDEKHFDTGGRKIPDTVNGLKSDFYKKTGNQLVFDESLYDGPGSLISQRRYDAFVEHYTAGIKEHEQRLIEENARKDKAQKEAEQNKRYDECTKDKDCLNDRNITIASRQLNNIYYTLMAQNPYQQAEYDLAVRRMCRSAGEAQRNGVSQEQLQKNIDLVEGIAPATRYQIKQVGDACWLLSRYGIPDGTTKISSVY